jgi:hypothetical protein
MYRLATLSSTRQIFANVSHDCIYNDGANSLNDIVPPTRFFGLSSEFPEVMIVCSKGVMSFTLAVGQARISDPTVNTAITASDVDFDAGVCFFPLLLLLTGVTKL